MLGVVSNDTEPVAERQASLNRSVAGNWDVFTGHRAKLTDLVSAASPRGEASLCVLGAGNCNDIDLGRAVSAYAEVHLVDIDADAMSEGVRRQHLAGDPRLHLHGGRDITGVAGLIERWRDHPPDDRTIDACLETLQVPHPLGPATPAFDVVLSAAILSQLTGSVIRLLGRDHPRSLEVALAVRDAHLSLMIDLLVRGGTGILVTDIASSTSSRILARSPLDAYPALFDDVLEEGALPGTDPLGIEASLTDAGRAGGIRRDAPWPWRLTHSRTQLMCAISFRRVEAGDARRPADHAGERDPRV
jgi:hypothetical protein